jgi:hypothetical protein
MVILLNDNIITAEGFVFLLQYASFKLRVVVEKKLFFAFISQAMSLSKLRERNRDYTPVIIKRSTTSH